MKDQKKKRSRRKRSPAEKRQRFIEALLELGLPEKDAVRVPDHARTVITPKKRRAQPKKK